MKFFSLPPKTIKHPYILLNAMNPDEGIYYLLKNGAKVAIIDSGIEIFRNPKVKDYPPKHFERILKVYERASELSECAYVTVPDYCDDYIPGNLWLSDEVTNIERTHENILKAVDCYPDINWLIPIQGHNEKPRSVLKSIDLLAEANILPKYDYYAVANLCTSKSETTIRSTLNFVRWQMWDKKLHAFGISLSAARKLEGVLDSFDSMAWTFPRGRGGHSCNTKAERVDYFNAYLQVLANVRVRRRRGCHRGGDALG